MPKYKLSTEADADIESITEYTTLNFGARQAVKYTSALENSFDLLGLFPGIGLPCYDLREGLHRFPYKSHMIFYTHAPDHIIVVRILYGRADFKRYF